MKVDVYEELQVYGDSGAPTLFYLRIFRSGRRELVCYLPDRELVRVIKEGEYGE